MEEEEFEMVLGQEQGVPTARFVSSRTATNLTGDKNGGTNRESVLYVCLLAFI